jgi:hypothetical protein
MGSIEGEATMMIDYDVHGNEIGMYWQTEEKFNDWFEEEVVADINKKIEPLLATNHGAKSNVQSKKGKGIAYQGDCCKIPSFLFKKVFPPGSLTKKV